MRSDLDSKVMKVSFEKVQTVCQQRLSVFVECLICYFEIKQVLE